jgi:hypothetical protein
MPAKRALGAVSSPDGLCRQPAAYAGYGEAAGRRHHYAFADKAPAADDILL